MHARSCGPCGRCQALAPRARRKRKPCGVLLGTHGLRRCMCERVGGARGAVEVDAFCTRRGCPAPRQSGVCRRLHLRCRRCRLWSCRGRRRGGGSHEQDGEPAHAARIGALLLVDPPRVPTLGDGLVRGWSRLGDPIRCVELQRYVVRPPVRWVVLDLVLQRNASKALEGRNTLAREDRLVRHHLRRAHAGRVPGL